MISILQDSGLVEGQIKKILSRIESTAIAGDKKFNTFGTEQNLSELVSTIISRVEETGDQAVADCVAVIDKVQVSPSALMVAQKEFEAARNEISEDLEHSLQLMASRIREYAEQMMPKMETWFDEKEGRKLGYRFTPLDRLGAYVPGGLAGSTPLISTVLMNLIPAKVAGVKEIVVATPCNPEGKVHPCLLRACEIAGAEFVYRAGGAQGVAAMALGTETCPPCCKIIGPGNMFVQEAKRQLFGKIDIDMMAGPSEIAILADEHALPEVLAADMIAQAEHDKMASSVLFSDSINILEETKKSLEQQVKALPKKEIAEESLLSFGALVKCESLDEACEWIDELAPEHLELYVREPKLYLNKVRHAGAIFLGEYTPEVVGDYTAGPSHTLPTCGAAKFSSGITVYSFLKSSSLLEYTSDAMSKDMLPLTAMAREENLEGHARSAESRKPLLKSE